MTSFLAGFVGLTVTGLDKPVVGLKSELLASASIGDRVGLYGPAHDITGKGVANPLASILSAALLLDISFGLKAENLGRRGSNPQSRSPHPRHCRKWHPRQPDFRNIRDGRGDFRTTVTTCQINREIARTRCRTASTQIDTFPSCLFFSGSFNSIPNSTTKKHPYQQASRGVLKKR